VTLALRSRSFPDDATLVMAIVNRTPDSFYDKGATWQEDRAFDRVDQVVAQGAEIVDIGGIKAAPGEFIDEAEEIRRVASFVGRVRDRHPGLVISVDTWRSGVARAVLEEGADVLNDAWGGADPGLVDAAAEYGAAIICTHTGGDTPRTRPFRMEYDDLLAAVLRDLRHYADRTRSTNETTRRFSSSSSMNSPGAALIPPMSTISAPSSTTCATRSKALSSTQVAPLS
jgi:dihydropteroate synthase